ncbi:hypothetical protein BLNAU_10091 [Blattamonas nauphoetae]|uniref:Uncharacterized protein n=1 Tax=Blattamonas nauphoetae TaxID=2049346 RepID=A0ABQ9XTZ3_9EUKA|nr:hypothetical protein BLNAU_10091 [Blattamonas nauphoetae]
MEPVTGDDRAEVDSNADLDENDSVRKAKDEITADNFGTAEVRLALVKADLIPQITTTLNPQSLSFTEAVDIHTNLMISITHSVWLSTPDGLAELGIEDRDEQQAVHETVLKQILVPSEKNRHEPAIFSNCFCSVLDNKHSHDLIRGNDWNSPSTDVTLCRCHPLPMSPSADVTLYRCLPLQTTTLSLHTISLSKTELQTHDSRRPTFSQHFSHPLDPSKPETLFAAIMIELVKTFTLSGDLLPSHHPPLFFTDLFKQQYHFYKKELPDREPFLAQNLSWNFEVTENHKIFEDFVKLVKSIAEKEEIPHFLLNTNFEEPNNPPHSPHDTDPFPMVVQFDGIADLTPIETATTVSSVDSKSSPSSSVACSNPTGSLETILPPSLSVQDVVTFPYLSTPRVEMLGMIHDLLSAPPILSPPPPPRPALSDVELHSSALFASSLELDLNERFDISLFDEEDDDILLQTLHRCYQCCRATECIDCIVNPLTFLERLVLTLSSRNRFIRRGSTFLVDRILSYVDFIDPRDAQFRSLRYSFRDGEREEQSTLLNLWSDFDFDGFVSTDLSDPLLFDLSIMFRLLTFQNEKNCSLDKRTTLDIILQFEQRNNALARISMLAVEGMENQTSRSFKMSHVAFALILAVYHKITFPWNLLEAIVNGPMAEKTTSFDIAMLPSFCVHHSSVDPRWDPHFSFLDVLFECFLRVDPSQLVSPIWETMLDHSPTLLFTPLFGLHSFFMRSQHLRLSSIDSARLAKVLIASTQPYLEYSQELTSLYSTVPPPLLLRFFMSCQNPQLVKQNERRFVMHTIAKLIQYSTPFGDCISLTNVFKMLLHTDPVSRDELNKVVVVRENVIARNWFQIPTSFDSPHIAHLRSLHPSRHRILPSISEETGMTCLLSDRTDPVFTSLVDEICRTANAEDWLTESVLILRSLTPDTIRYNTSLMKGVLSIFDCFLSSVPARVSLAFEFCKRFLQMCLDLDRLILVRNGLMDAVVLAVYDWPFLEDYENGVVVIGILLNTIRRVR